MKLNKVNEAIGVLNDLFSPKSNCAYRHFFVSRKLGHLGVRVFIKPQKIAPKWYNHTAPSLYINIKYIINSLIILVFKKNKSLITLVSVD